MNATTAEIVITAIEIELSTSKSNKEHVSIIRELIRYYHMNEEERRTFQIRNSTYVIGYYI